MEKVKIIFNKPINNEIREWWDKWKANYGDDYLIIKSKDLDKFNNSEPSVLDMQPGLKVSKVIKL